jgi:hypothetical protein
MIRPGSPREEQPLTHAYRWVFHTSMAKPADRPADGIADKRDALGLQHDTLTISQEAYVASWTTGT